jgi:hypothetical protein
MTEFVVRRRTKNKNAAALIRFPYPLPKASVYAVYVLMSTNRPSRAAAAAMIGDTRWVRPL